MFLFAPSHHVFLQSLPCRHSLLFPILRTTCPHWLVHPCIWYLRHTGTRCQRRRSHLLVNRSPMTPLVPLPLKPQLRPLPPPPLWRHRIQKAKRCNCRHAAKLSVIQLPCQTWQLPWRGPHHQPCPLLHPSCFPRKRRYGVRPAAPPRLLFLHRLRAFIAQHLYCYTHLG
jgi:hypothetical protein